MNRGNVVWSGVEAGASATFSVLSSFVVARIVGPSELGVGAAIVSVHVLLWVCVNSLFADALVQRDALDRTLVSAALWGGGAAGAAAMLVQAGAGLGLQHLMHDSRMLPMALLLALPLPMVGLGGVVQGLLTRRRAYRRLALRTLCGQGLGTATGIGLALAGDGAWALVAQQAVVSAVGAAALLPGGRSAAGGFENPPVRGRSRWRAMRSLLAVGLPLTASTMTLIGRYRLFAVLIGGIAGPAALGQVHMAFRLVDTVKELTFTALWRLMLPILSERQHDPEAMGAQVDRLLRWSSLVTMPLCAALALLLPSMVILLLGIKWTEAGSAAEPLVGLMTLMALMFPSGVALVAVGEARQALYGNLAGLLASIASVLLLRPTEAGQAVMVWCASQVLVSPLPLWLNARALRVGVLRPLRAGVPMLGVSLAGLALVAGAPAILGSGPSAGMQFAVRACSLALFALVAAGVWALLRRLNPAPWPGLR